MFKTLGISMAAALSAASAFAGSVAFEAPVEPMMIEEQGSMGGSGLWLLPLLAIALIFLVMKSPTPPPNSPI